MASSTRGNNHNPPVSANPLPVIWWLIAVMLATLALYIYSLAPTVCYGTNCGEMITNCYTLGVAHPTGYPMYLMVGKAFTALPIGDVAYRVNLMSAVFAVLTAAIVYWILWSNTGQLPAALLGSLSFASGAGVWSQAVIAEAYTFNVFLQGLLLLAALRWRRSHDARWLYTIGFLFGLGLGAHGLTFITFPAYLVWFFMNRKGEPVFTSLGIALLCAFTGAMVLWYLPLRASTHPPINWGEIHDWNSFYAHVTGRQFHTLIGSAMDDLPRRLAGYGLFVWLHFNVVVALLAVGVLVSVMKHTRDFIFYFLLVLINSGYFLTFGQSGVYFQLVPSFMIYGILIGLGCAWLTQRLTASFRDRQWLPAAVAAVAFTAMWVSQVAANYPNSTMRGNYHPRQDVAEVLQQAPQHAVVVAGLDQIWYALMYYHFVEGVRQDIAVEHTGNVIGLMKHYRGRPVCTMFPPRKLPRGYFFEPIGTFGLVRKDSVPLRYVEPSQFAASGVQYEFHTTDSGTVSLMGANLHPAFMRREGMSTLYTYWRVSKHTTHRVAAVYVFRFKRAAGEPRSASISAADKRLLTRDQFGWAQYHPLTTGWSIDAWTPGRLVEDRLPIQPPWTIVEGIYEIHAAIVPQDQPQDVEDYALPESIKTDTLPKVGELEVYMQ